MEKNEEGVYPRIFGYLNELSHPQGRGAFKVAMSKRFPLKKKVPLYVAYVPFYLMGNPWKITDSWCWTLRRQT